ncbi:hypothetical protein DP62_6278 [Burkholderia pseudomallei]|nr:hypothetical protein DP62_6278 [Burkholderia pseudomallei]
MHHEIRLHVLLHRGAEREHRVERLVVGEREALRRVRRRARRIARGALHAFAVRRLRAVERHVALHERIVHAGHARRLARGEPLVLALQPRDRPPVRRARLRVGFRPSELDALRARARNRIAPRRHALADDGRERRVRARERAPVVANRLVALLGLARIDEPGQLRVADVHAAALHTD